VTPSSCEVVILSFTGLFQCLVPLRIFFSNEIDRVPVIDRQYLLTDKA
jgi:hypothetical protein